MPRPAIGSRLDTRLYPYQEVMLREAARAAGLTLAEFIRLAVEEKCARVRESVGAA